MHSFTLDIPVGMPGWMGPLSNFRSSPIVADTNSRTIVLKGYRVGAANVSVNLGWIFDSTIVSSRRGAAMGVVLMQDVGQVSGGRRLGQGCGTFKVDISIWYKKRIYCYAREP